MYTSDAASIRADYETGLYTKSALARQYHCDRHTIYRILDSDDEYVYVRTKHPENCLIQPYRKVITKMLKMGNPEASAIWRMLTDKGVKISKSTVVKEVRRIKRELDLAEIRYETEPGQQAQVDWGEFQGFTATVDGKERQLYAFFMILGYSRMRYVEFTTEMTTPVLIRCIENGLHYYGGCPKEILFDNMPQVVNRVMKTPWSIDKTRTLLPEFTAFADYTGFSINLARVRRPQEKGKVERIVEFFKSDFMPILEKKTGHNLKDLNSRALHWCNIVNSEIHCTTGEIPLKRLPDEELDPLPLTRYYDNNRIKVHKDGRVFYHGGIYQADIRFAGCTGTAEDIEGVIFADIDDTFVVLGKRNLPVRVKKRYLTGADMTNPIRNTDKVLEALPHYHQKKAVISRAFKNWLKIAFLENEAANAR